MALRIRLITPDFCECHVGLQLLERCRFAKGEAFYFFTNWRQGCRSGPVELGCKGEIVSGLRVHCRCNELVKTSELIKGNFLRS